MAEQRNIPGYGFIVSPGSNQRIIPGVGALFAASGAVNLTSANCSQAGTSSSDSIVQVYILTGNNTAQSNLSSSVAITIVTYYPGSDVTTTGWTATPSSPYYDKIDETSLDTGDYITSPNAFTPGPITMTWTNNVPIGSWDITVNAKQNTGTGSSIRIVLLDVGNSVVGTSSWISVSGTDTDYTVPVVTTGISTSFRIEVL